MPMPGANTRLYTVAPSPTFSDENRNTGSSSSSTARMNASYAGASSAALSTARLVASGTSRNGTPHDTVCTGNPVAVTAAPDRRNAAAAPDGSGIGEPKAGVGCVIHTKLNSPSRHVSETGVGPTPRPSTRQLWPGPTTPARASANVVPTVG